MGKHKNDFVKVMEEDADKMDGAIPFDTVASAVIRKRDFIAKEAGINPEDVVLCAYKLVFVVGNRIKTQNIEGAFICQTCSVKGGYEFLTKLVDSDD